MEERTLLGVTKDYLEISNTMNRLMDSSQAPNGTRDDEYLRIQWAVFENILLNRIGLCERAIANLTSIHEAYTVGVPLLTYKYTKVRNCDVEKLQLIIKSVNVTLAHLELSYCIFMKQAAEWY